MPRRKKTTSRKKSRRVSGIGGGNMQQIGGAVLGAIGASFVNSKVAAMTKPIDPKILAVGEVVLGSLIAIKGKSPLVKGIGLGFAAAGGLNAAKSFGIVSGFRDLTAINGLKRVAGMSDRFKAVSGANQMKSLTPKAFPATQVISGLSGLGCLNVNGHCDGSV